MGEREIFREILSRISSEALTPTDVERIKLECCRRYSLSPVPKNSALLACAPPDERDALRRLLLVKPTRTLSGVAPIAVMTSPAPCPHGRCLPCPGGPDHAFHSPQSYTGEEPAALRAREHAYDPRGQVLARLDQLVALGHYVDKAELIVMGGTMTARSPEYQEWFVTECIRAMNDFDRADSGTGSSEGFENAAAANESAAVRCVATTFETRPDWCRREHVDRMLGLGVTKVELGVQQIDDAILAYNRRGCTVADTVEANRLLRDSGLKVGFHVMPNLPSASLEDDRHMFEELFTDERFRPDFLKIYPTLVTPGSEIETLWQHGEYSPYAEDDLVDLIAHAKACLPAYVRLQRVQRDIPAKLIVAGSRHSNFRQLAAERLAERGRRCRCIRCREAGRVPPHDEPRVTAERYAACGGLEHFVAAESGDALLGFARLRFPNRPHRPELDGAALLRELHVYGSMVPIGASAEHAEWQHRTFGHQLLGEAERISLEAGFRRLAIMSGIGVRPYYRKQGYERRGPYMIGGLA